MLKTIKIFSLIICLALLEAVFLPLRLVLLLIIWLAGRGEDIWLLGFISGIWIDLIGQRSLGTSSLWFLSVILLISFYRQKFQAEKLFFLLTFGFVAILLNNFLDQQFLRWEIVAVNSFMVIPLVWLGGRL